MKKMFLGGMLFLAGSIWGIISLACASAGNGMSDWNFNQFFSDMIGCGMLLPCIIGIAAMVIGFMIMLASLSEKD